MQNRTIDRVLLDVKLDTNSPQVSVKFELRDDGGSAIYARRILVSTNWATASLSRSDFSSGDVAAFDWTKVKFLSVIVQRRNVGDGVDNPESAAILVDNLRLVDDDGLYPDLSSVTNQSDGSLRPEYSRAFLELYRRA